MTMKLLRGTALGAVLGISIVGCNATSGTTDAQLTSTIQAKIAGDTALTGQQITVAVQNGIVTLNGMTANNAEKTIAARDAAGVEGVKQVQNYIGIGQPGTAPVNAPTQ